MNPSALPEVLGEHYAIECEIGRGGMATVYRAYDRRHRRMVAVKVLAREIASTIGTTRFLQEITTVAGLSHPNIVPVHDSGAQDGNIYYVMPYVSGETLRERLESGKPIHMSEVIHWTERIASALDFAHRRSIIHRDIKPENIMLFEDEPLILDFGIARAVSAAGGERLTETGVALGTPAYLSPEQASGEADIDGSSDQYSLACTVYELLSRIPPFSGATRLALIAKRFTEKPRSLSELVPGISTGAATAVARALSIEPRDRFPSVTEFARALASPTEGRTTSATVGKPSIAVLPFANMSTDADNDFFADGMTEEIINTLTRVSALNVPSRTASFAFKGREQDFDEIARKLKVNHVLEGSVRKSGTRLRVSVQLVAVDTGNAIWSDRYDRELADVFAIQDEITRSIVAALKVVFLAAEETPMRGVPTRDVRAYEYYLRGRQLYHQRRPETIAVAEEMYNKAIAIDPDYALAYAGIADCSAVRYGSFGGGAAALEKAEAAISEALKRNPMLAEAHAARGLLMSYRSSFAEADVEFKEALRLDPHSYDAAYHYGRMLTAAGRIEDSIDPFERAATLRPDDYQALSFAEAAYFTLGRNDEAAKCGQRVIEAAEHALAINPGDARALSMGAITLLRLGERERAEEWSQRALHLDSTNAMTLYNAACFFSVAGQLDAALDYLERAIARGFRHTNWLLHDPDIEAIRGRPRFLELLQRSRAD